MSSINFGNVYLLFIAIPLLAVLSVPFFIAVKRDNRNGHNIASMVLHVLMALLIAFAAAGTEIVTVITETDVYVVADVSYSAEKNLDTIDGYIKDLRDNLPRNSKLGVVCFGKDYKVTTQLGKKLNAVRDAGVDDSESNISEALEYAGTLFKYDVIKRIVLITDGKQTYTDDPSDLLRTVSNLKAQGIKVDAIYLNDNIDDTAKEVQISGAEYTANTFVNHSETVTLKVQSSYVSNCIINLYKDGEQFRTTSQTLSLGSNSVIFELDTSTAGTFAYRAEISAGEDECSFNNVYSFTQTVTEAVSVLLITADDGDAEKVQSLYGGNTQITSLNVRKTKDIPVGVEDLCKYDEIVLSEVDVTEIDNYEMFITSLNTAVSMFGKSLITFGNMSIQSKTEGELKLLDNMLPVRYGDVEGNPKLYTFVLDVSHSMSIWSRMLIAKQAAAMLINMLSDNDYVSLVTFAGDVQLTLSPTSLTNRSEILNAFNDISFRQGTVTSLGLKKAMETARNLNFSEKQVMLITDGLPYDGEISLGDVDIDGVKNDRSYAAAYVSTMRNTYGMYTSVLQVGGNNTGDRTWLIDLAQTGGGNYFLAETEDALADVGFASDFAGEAGSAVVEETSIINVDRPHDGVLDKVSEDGVKSSISLGNGYVSRYVLSSSKSSASNVLSVDYKPKGSSVSISVPLYAYWNYGNGKVATYTGNIAGIKLIGGGGSVYHGDNEKFFSNILESSVPSERTDYPYTLSVGVVGKRARIELSPASLQAKASAKITVTTPSDERITDIFVFNSTLYYYEFITPDVGNYKVDVTYSYGGNDYTADASFTLSYAPEYDRFAVFEASVLYKMLGGDGTVSEDGNLVIENDESEIATYVLNLTLPFLIITVIIYIVDIVIRKLKWNDIVSLFGKVGSNKRSKK